MPVAGVVSLILVFLLVTALAAYLIWVVFILRHAVDTLGKVTFGVRAIAHRTEPVGPVLADVNANLTAVAEALEGLVASASETHARAS
ncbi:MAG: hypothetical protein H0U21_04560 [Acidimicrobiia bacterium]|nr:hypothetical protein [Acidimicrobiia bacterium]